MTSLVLNCSDAIYVREYLQNSDKYKISFHKEYIFYKFS